MSRGSGGVPYRVHLGAALFRALPEKKSPNDQTALTNQNDPEKHRVPEGDPGGGLYPLIGLEKEKVAR